MTVKIGNCEMLLFVQHMPSGVFFFPDRRSSLR